MPQPFPPNKTAKELGIDLTRLFTVIGENLRLEKGTNVRCLSTDRDSFEAEFSDRRQGWSIYWKDLAYADESILDRKYVSGIPYTEKTLENLEAGDVASTDAPVGRTWEMRYARTQEEVTKLLLDGWEPYAVTEKNDVTWYYFKRLTPVQPIVEASEVDISASNVEEKDKMVDMPLKHEDFDWHKALPLIRETAKEVLRQERAEVGVPPEVAEMKIEQLLCLERAELEARKKFDEFIKHLK